MLGPVNPCWLKHCNCSITVDNGRMGATGVHVSRSRTVMSRKEIELVAENYFTYGIGRVQAPGSSRPKAHELCFDDVG